MNITSELLRRADQVLDQYRQSVRRPNVMNVTGFASSLIQLFRRNPDPQALLKVLQMPHPRPQIREHWQSFSRAVDPQIRNLAGRPSLILKFLGYLKRKAYIRSKQEQKGKLREKTGAQTKHKQKRNHHRRHRR